LTTETKKPRRGPFWSGPHYPNPFWGKTMIAIIRGKAVYTVTDFVLNKNLKGIEITTIDNSNFTPVRYGTLEEAQKALEDITETVISKGHEAVIIL
jgi:hypothetical protein